MRILILFLSLTSAAFGAAEMRAQPERLGTHQERAEAARKIFPHVFKENRADVSAFKTHFAKELEAITARHPELTSSVNALRDEDVFFAVSRKSWKSGLFLKLKDTSGADHLYLVSTGHGQMLPEKTDASRFNHDAHGMHLDTHDKRVVVIGKDGDSSVRVRSRNVWERIRALLAWFYSGPKGTADQTTAFSKSPDLNTHRRADSNEEPQGEFATNWRFKPKSAIRKDRTLDRDAFLKTNKRSVGEMFMYAQAELKHRGSPGLKAHEFLNRASIQVGSFTDTSGQERVIPFVTFDKDGVQMAFAVAEKPGLFAKSRRSWDFPHALPIARGGAIELASGDRLIVQPGQGYQWALADPDAATTARSIPNQVYTFTQEPVRVGYRTYYSYDPYYYSRYDFYTDLMLWDIETSLYRDIYWGHHGYYDYGYGYGHYGYYDHADTTIINNNETIVNNNTVINDTTINDTTLDTSIPSGDIDTTSAFDPAPLELAVPPEQDFDLTSNGTGLFGSSNTDGNSVFGSSTGGSDGGLFGGSTGGNDSLLGGGAGDSAF